MRVGDRVKVYGYATGSDAVKADNVRVFTGAYAAGKGSSKEINASVDKKSELIPVSDAQLVPQLPLTNWEGKGIVTDINLLGRQIKMQTSCGEHNN